MKKFKVKNYKGNLLESLKKFQDTHKELRVVEAYDEGDMLAVAAEPLPPLPPPAETNVPPVEPVDNPTNPVFDFGCRLLMFGVKAHIWHLNCTKYGQHLALKDLYEKCDEAGDALLEAEIGIVGAPIDHFGFDLNGANLDFSEASIDEIEAIKSSAEALASQGFGNGINNILDDFCATCNSIIYKLKRLD